MLDEDEGGFKRTKRMKADEKLKRVYATTNCYVRLSPACPPIWLIGTQLPKIKVVDWPTKLHLIYLNLFIQQI